MTQISVSEPMIKAQKNAQNAFGLLFYGMEKNEGFGSSFA